MVSRASLWTWARPKSVTHRPPRPSTSRLAGFTSRWTTPRACAWSSASAAWAPSSATRRKYSRSRGRRSVGPAASGAVSAGTWGTCGVVGCASGGAGRPPARRRSAIMAASDWPSMNCMA
jgi:hypothetical protein